MRLNKFLSVNGVCSRRKADSLIREGKVTLNGTVVSRLGVTVGESDTVCVNGKPIGRESRHVYFIFNKPKEVTTTVRDIHADKTVMDYLPSGCKHLFPVGRLDKYSRGLLILTNDGDLCYRLTHPRFKIEKEYLLYVQGECNDAVIKKMRSGIIDEGERLRVKSVRYSNQNGEVYKLYVIVTEGKKRHLRRICRGVHLTVLDLKRIRIAGLELGHLKEGEMKQLTHTVIYRKLFRGKSI